MVDHQGRPREITMKVSDVMTRRVISVTPEATVRHAIYLMLRGPEFVAGPALGLCGCQFNSSLPQRSVALRGGRGMRAEKRHSP